MTSYVDPFSRLPDPQNPDVRDLDAKTTKPAASTDAATVQKSMVSEIFGKFASKVPIVGDFVEALTGVEDGDYQDLGTFASLLFGRDVSLASRVAAIENKIAVGAEYFDNFKRGDNDSVLGSPDPGTIAAWIQFGDGESLGIHDQAAQMTRSAFPDDGVRYARCPFLATSNDYVVAAVIHPKGTPNQPRTSLYGRCNADGTEGVYVDFFGNKTRIGRFTRSGNTVTRSQWLETSKAYSNSSTPQLRMVGTRYQVVIDDIVIVDHVDVSGFPVDAAHRTSMFSVQCFTAILQVPVWSGGLASFAVRNADQSGVQKAQQTAENAVSTAVTEATNAANAVVDSVQSNLDTAVTTINNRIDTLAGGVVQYTFTTTGTFTQPAGMTRCQVSAIGGSAGGARYRFVNWGGGCGGWTKWYELLASEVAATETVVVGTGGTGATTDATYGTSGTQSSFAGLVVGGGQCTSSGPINGFGTELAYSGSGGRGGATDYAASNGGNGPFSNGGIVGGPTGGGAAGNNGSSPASGLIGPGSGGAGGQQKNGTGNGGNGGNGGYPGGGGGGGGNYVNLGTTGNGGNGAAGYVVIRCYFN